MTPAPSSDPSLVTIVVPHLNQPAALATCLASLAAQEGARRSIEVIVVDNGSRALPDDVTGAWPNVTLLVEPTPGPGPARNAGVARARGSILAFIDADCQAHPGWVRAIEAALDDPALSVIGGDVRVAYADPLRPTFVEPYEAIYSYRFEKHIREGYAGTGNLAVRREVFDAVGPFGGIEIAEDRDWGLRARALGHVTRYVPDMIVYHPARESFAELTQKWDRHLEHEWSALKGPAGRAAWVLKSLAMGVSPLAEIPTVLRSPLVGGPRERMLAFACLVRVRLYRTRRMFAIAGTPAKRTSARSWNRD